MFHEKISAGGTLRLGVAEWYLWLFATDTFEGIIFLLIGYLDNKALECVTF